MDWLGCLSLAAQDGLDLKGWIALATLVVATTLFITRWIPLPMTALGIPVVLYATGVLDAPDDPGVLFAAPKEALVGFGNHAVLAICAIFVVGAALKESGVATLMARGLQRIGGRREVGLLSLIMLATALLAAFMNNTAVVAILLPAVAALAARAGIAPSRIMMPMAFAAVLGGTISLIGTAPNFIVADYYAEEFPGQQIGVFEFAKVGIPITVVGIVAMAVFGRRLLPVIRREDRMTAARLPKDAADSYKLAEKLFKMLVVKGSKVAGMTIADADIRKRYNLGVIMIRRPGTIGDKWLQPTPDLVLQPDDVMYAQGDHQDAWMFAESELLQLGLPTTRAIERLLGHGTTLAEVAPAPRSRALDRSFKELDFRKRTGLNVVALWRRNEPIQEGLADERLQMGDAFLVSGSSRRVLALAQNPDYIVLTDLSQGEDVTRAPVAIGILLLTLLPPVVFGFPLAISAIGGAVLMVATGCIARHAVVRAIDWKVLAMLCGTLPLGIALKNTGISGIVADWFEVISDMGGLTAVFAALFLMAAGLSVLTSNAAAAAIMAPVAVQSAAGLEGLDPKGALLAMAYGCSCNFLLPFAQCNLLVMSPGGYGTRDYVRVGAFMTVVMAVTTITVLALM